MFKCNDVLILYKNIVCLILKSSQDGKEDIVWQQVQHFFFVNLGGDGPSQYICDLYVQSKCFCGWSYVTRSVCKTVLQQRNDWEKRKKSN